MKPNTSQGSAATYVRCNHFSANLLENLPAEEFWKSVKIWKNYGHEFGVEFFLTHPVRLLMACVSIINEWMYCPARTGGHEQQQRRVTAPRTCRLVPSVMVGRRQDIITRAVGAISRWPRPRRACCSLCSAGSAASRHSPLSHTPTRWRDFTICNAASCNATSKVSKVNGVRVAVASRLRKLTTHWRWLVVHRCCCWKRRGVTCCSSVSHRATSLSTGVGRWLVRRRHDRGRRPPLPQTPRHQRGRRPPLTSRRCRRTPGNCGMRRRHDLRRWRPPLTSRWCPCRLESGASRCSGGGTTVDDVRRRRRGARDSRRSSRRLGTASALHEARRHRVHVPQGDRSLQTR